LDVGLLDFVGFPLDFVDFGNGCRTEYGDFVLRDRKSEELVLQFPRKTEEEENNFWK
jgi:hypothetical protein